MENRSRIKFNPVTKEIEVEGSESFVKTYFNKIQNLLSAQEEIKEQKAAKATRVRKAPVKKGNIFDTVMEIIKTSEDGTTTAALKEKTGLTEQQIRSVIYRAEKQGKIRKAKRGVYAIA